MAVLRVILGGLEARFYAGYVYLLSTRYPHFELQTRDTSFYLVGSMASAFADILAYGLMQLNGHAGWTGWRCIFIVSAFLTSCFPVQNRENFTGHKLSHIEGTITCVLGIFAYMAIVYFPELSPKSWHFLNHREAAFVVARI